MFLLGAGLFLTIRLKFINIRGFVHAIRIVKGDFDDPNDPGDITHFQALTTALSATVGVGNIAGVATAIHYGGPGALLWMWVTAGLGMTTKFTECSLALRYRVKNNDGTVSGGPMYYISEGLRLKPLAFFFAACAAISSFGSGNAVQAHTMADSMHAAFGIPTWITGGVGAVIVALVILGGIKRIGAFTSAVVPVMAAIYTLATVTILIIFAKEVPGALLTIVRDALRPTAALGGFAGATFLFGLTWGVKRGLFSNEAGQGSAPIAHAAARTEEPIREGSVALLEPFIDTLTICTLTGLVIVATGVWQNKQQAKLPMNVQSNITLVSAGCAVGTNSKLNKACALPPNIKVMVRGGRLEGAALVVNHSLVDDAQVFNLASPLDGMLTVDAKSKLRVYDSSGKVLDGARLEGKMLQNGGPLTASAFQAGLSTIFPWGSHLVAICVLLFALSTAIGWSYYGERSAHYLLRDRVVLPYRTIFVVMHFVGAVIPLETVWSFADAALGMMSLPNLIAIVLLSGQVARMSRDYFSRDHVPTKKLS
ncbi:MAG: alanine:cation symporter family protein [Deltaproteobacteria bacterium]|nr:alanine:cation symporter family protein [Deltaproteobacteria bacterium]